MSSQVSNSLDKLLPPLDTHAHVDPTVTAEQLATLGRARIFAVTRSLSEAAHVVGRNDPNLIWGLGVHPGLPDELASYDPARLRQLLPDFLFIGEVGLDRRSPVERAQEVLADVLQAVREGGRLASVHSTGRHGPTLELLEDDATGVILHWFTGTPAQVDRAARAGAYFSVNSSMSDAKILAVPSDRLLPETDFPFTRGSGSRLPGDIEELERRVATLLGLSRDATRQLWYRNLRQLCVNAKVLHLLPPSLARSVLAA